MGLRDVERRIERGVDGVVGRIFRSRIDRLEIEKRIERELDAGAMRGRHGNRVMPNDVRVRLHPADLAGLGTDLAELRRELVELARGHARDAECGFDGPLVVRVEACDTVRPGMIDADAVIEQAIEGIPPGTLVFPDGNRFDLALAGAGGITIGRDRTADVVLEDEKASRIHARLRPSSRGWILDDLDSTNGTRVNGFRTGAQLLSDGDSITIGATTFSFDAS